MRGPEPTSPWIPYGLCLVFLLPLGCSSQNASAQPEEQRRLQLLANLYVRYGAGPKHPGRSPPDAKSFKEFIQQLSAQELRSLNISNVDELFVSPRDSLPYVINYNMRAPRPAGPTSGSKPGSATTGELGNPVIAYETLGSGGKRYVAYATGQVELVDRSKAAELKLK